MFFFAFFFHFPSLKLFIKQSRKKNQLDRNVCKNFAFFFFVLLAKKCCWMSEFVISCCLEIYAISCSEIINLISIWLGITFARTYFNFCCKKWFKLNAFIHKMACKWIHFPNQLDLSRYENVLVSMMWNCWIENGTQLIRFLFERREKKRMAQFLLKNCQF